MRFARPECMALMTKSNGYWADEQQFRALEQQKILEEKTFLQREDGERSWPFFCLQSRGEDGERRTMARRGRGAIFFPCMIEQVLDSSDQARDDMWACTKQ
ncbi:unnamed protein product [Urochloa humidicola]